MRIARDPKTGKIYYDDNVADTSFDKFKKHTGAKEEEALPAYRYKPEAK